MIGRLARDYRVFGQRMFEDAIERNHQNIEYALRSERPGGSLLDLGCDDGRRTMRWAKAANASSVHGVEVIETQARKAEELGIVVAVGNLDGRLPYDDGSFDYVVSNQVIEHVFDTDLFVAEAYRVLRPGGVVVTSTENLASWHNIGATVLGWQPFSLTNVSTKGAVGNPMALMAGGHLAPRIPEGGDVSWQHRRLFATRGLADLHAAHGFEQVHCLGAGYYPLPSSVGERDVRHAAFITAVGTRPPGV